ncbi:hypothetical protein FALBO_12595 [Fusarium albosuccineum]|uniref:Uncharacterized protein n=1 Tax=Fusarium albosuccineum TaxID=1237068 RepID=A0A8H4L036_9HYPO|nr:hypothetical protein FALBO_12595 [Fusarium albosuccineum]
MSTKRRRRDDGPPPGPQMKSSSTASQQRDQATQTETDSLVEELRAGIKSLESDEEHMLTRERLIQEEKTARELGSAVGLRDETITQQKLEMDLLQTRLSESEAIIVSKDRTIRALEKNIQQVKQAHEDKVKQLKERARNAKLALGDD